MEERASEQLCLSVHALCELQAGAHERRVPQREICGVRGPICGPALWSTAEYPQMNLHDGPQSAGFQDFGETALNPAARASWRWRPSKVTNTRSPSSSAVATWSTSSVRQ